MGYKRSEAKIEGTAELIKELKALGVNVRKTLRGTMRAGGKVIGEAAEANAPESSKRGKKISVAIVAATSDRVTAAVGPNKRHFNLRYFETGVPAHAISGNPLLQFTNRGGDLVKTGRVSHPGMAARPFLRPAFDSQGDQAVKVVGESLRLAVEEARIAAEGEDD
jgi:HK97 gp10 family phage protein